MAAGARYLLFLNNDVEAREPGWIARLRSLAGRAGGRRGRAAAAVRQRPGAACRRAGRASAARPTTR